MRTGRVLAWAVGLATVGALAWPVVPVANAAPAVTSTAPTNGSTITAAASLPTLVSATFDVTLSGSAAVTRPSAISVTKDGSSFPCTAALSADSKSLTCTPASPSNFVDGSYVVSYDAQPVVPNPLDGLNPDTSGSFSFTIQTSAPQLVSTTPANGTIGKSPATVTATYDHVLVGSSPISVKNGIGGSVAGT